MFAFHYADGVSRSDHVLSEYENTAMQSAEQQFPLPDAGMCDGELSFNPPCFAHVAVGTRVSSHAHRVTGDGHPPPVPTERSVRFSRTTLFGSWFAAPREPVAAGKGGTALVAVTEFV